MKNKKCILIAILLLSCLFNLHAEINLDQNYKDKYPHGTFEISAYKNNTDSDTTLITLYDALTTALTEIPNDSRRDLYPHLRGFVVDAPEAVDKQNAVFSFIVSGTKNRAFSLNISLHPFVYQEITGYKGENQTEPIIVEHKIDSVYKLVSTKAYYSKTKKETDYSGKNTISRTDSIDGPIHTVDTANGNSLGNKLMYSWNIIPAGGNSGNDFWVVEGVVVLGIQKTGDYGYDNAKPGSYEAVVTVEFKSIT